MNVVANGDPVELPDGATVDDLLGALGLGGRWVIVELNGAPVERAALSTTVLRADDRIELVRAVAGG